MSERVTRIVNGLIAFTKVAELGSFTAAARATGTPLATVSRRVAELEAELGVRLLHRTTRKVSLTDVGRRYVEHGRRIVQEVDSAEAAAARATARPSGRVKISAPVLFGRYAVAPVVADFLTQYSDVRASLHLSDHLVHLVEEGFDFVVRGGALPDSGLVARPAGQIVSGLYASPALLARRGLELDPGNLADLPLIDIRVEGVQRRRWILMSGRERTEVEFTPVHEVNDAEAAVSLAEAGLGVCNVPTFIGEPRRDSGHLVRLLPGWTAGTADISIVYPSARGQTPAVRLLIETLLARLRPARDPGGSIMS